MKVPIYVVSLARDIQRRENINNIFSKLSIEFNFLDATDSKDPNNKPIINQMRLTGIGSEMTDGEIACALSHQRVYQNILSQSNEWAIILEDDIILDNRFKNFLSAFNKDEESKLKKDNLYLLGGQKGLHDYPVLGVSRRNIVAVGNCKFGRVNYNKDKIRRTCCYLMNKSMAQQLIDLMVNFGIYRADSWPLIYQSGIIKEFYLDEIIFHPKVNETNSHLELERNLILVKKQPRTRLQKAMKLCRSWIKVVFYSFLK